MVHSFGSRPFITNPSKSLFFSLWLNSSWLLMICNRVIGYIKNYVRRFWQVWQRDGVYFKVPKSNIGFQHSEDHRGTPEKPGRVVTLIPFDEWKTIEDVVIYRLKGILICIVWHPTVAWSWWCDMGCCFQDSIHWCRSNSCIPWSSRKGKKEGAIKAEYWHMVIEWIYGAYCRCLQCWGRSKARCERCNA